MKHLKTIRTIALGAALLAMSAMPKSAEAAVTQSGTTTVTVTMPEYLVLHY
ncbi:hypothetical protein G9409_10290, partial [Chlorobium sp. BLA1]|nr:hypothetical protein [Candidatus Chlorobium masyuteum]NHQ60963.1 hypothetical protein [Candidatus Chlorobium masyuteum]